MELIVHESTKTTERAPARVEHRIISLKSSRADTAVVGVAGNTGYYGYQITGEYLKILDGAKGRVVFDQMRRSDSQVQATLRAIKLPIRRCKYSVQPGGKTPQDKEIATVIQDGLFEQMSITWDDMIRHALLMMEFGFSPLEKVWERRGNMIMLKKLDSRLPVSIVSWKFDKVKKSLIGPEQMDLDGKRYVLPIEKMLIFTNEREGDNWEGTSILRSAYKAWYIKDQLEKINAIKHDRHGVGVPLAAVPPDVKEGTEQWAAVVASLEALYAQEQSYLIQPEGYIYSILGADGKSGTEVLPSIKYYDECIARSMLAMFINLGTSATGSRALGSSFIDVFMDSLQAYADYIADVMNRFLVREWVGHNWGEDVDMPKLVAGRIQPLDVPGLQAAVAAKLLTVDIELENIVRKQLNLPEREETDEAATDEAATDEEAVTDEPPIDENQEDVGLSERRLADEVLADEERLIDRATIEQRLNSQQATLADRLRAMRDRQVEAIAMQLVGGKLIQNVVVPLKKDMYDELVAAFKTSRRAGIADVEGEVKRQRPDLDMRRRLADPAKKKVKARAMADLELERMNVDVAGQASKTLSTVARWNIDLKQSGLQGDQLRVALASMYRDMSTSDLDKMAAGAVNKGWGVGRQDGFEAVADEIDYCYYSTMMDSGVCSECVSTQQAAGSQRHEPDDPDFATPNPQCLGGNLCRCMTIAVMRVESERTGLEGAREEASVGLGGPGSGRYPAGSGGSAKSIDEVERSIGKKTMYYVDSKYSSDQKVALVNYKGAGYERINDTLRKGETGSLPKGVSEIDAAIASGDTFPFDSEIMRGGVFNEDFVNKLEADSVFHDDGFMSTTYNEETAYGFALPRTPVERRVLFHITAPKGTRFVHLNGSEGEMLLARGTRMRITRVERKTGNLTRVFAEVVK